VDGAVSEFRGKDLVDQTVAFEERHLFKGGRNDRQADLGSAIAAPSLNVNVHVGDGGELFEVLALGSDKLFGNGGHDDDVE